MRVLVSSTPDELGTLAALAYEIVAEMGWEGITSDPGTAGSVEEGLEPIERADLLLALVGWRCGPSPGPIEGWNGSSPWVKLQVSRAFDLGKPVLVMMASEAWPEREASPHERALVTDFRAELDPLALTFGPESVPTSHREGDPVVPDFEALLRRELTAFADRASEPHLRPAPEPRSDLVPRAWQTPDFPPRPWPLLLPYSHPGLLAGRSSEIRTLSALLGGEQPILGLHAVSGTGKSSLLEGGLVPQLRAEGRPTAFERHPREPGIALRLVGDLLDGPIEESISDDWDHGAFTDLMGFVGRRSGSTPILILDQVEEMLRGDRVARAKIGMLMAATIQRRTWDNGIYCRWLLAYRREAHGEMVRWLTDVLREARSLGVPESDRLPHDLSSQERFRAWPLPVLGVAYRSANSVDQRGTDDVAGRDGAGRDGAAGTSAFEAFEAALSNPLALVDAAGEPRYGFRFEADGAARLARAFAMARLRDPEAPLVPELQVVLAELIDEASTDDARRKVLRVPEDPEAWIDGALDRHLVRAFDSVFAADDRLGRTRALLALYELADAKGQRTDGRTKTELIRAIGHQGKEVFEKLQAPDARLVVASQVDGESLYRLSHDRLAEVVATAVEGQGRLAVEPELLDLRRFVVLRTELFQSGERTTSTLVSRNRVLAIEKYADCLLTDPERLDWWRACLVRYHRSRRRRIIVWSSITISIVIAAWSIWSQFAQLAAREALLEQVGTAEPEAAFRALGQCLDEPRIHSTSVLEQLRNRPFPLDVLTTGMGGLPIDERNSAALRIGELVTPWVLSEQRPDLLSGLLWALDYGPGRDPELGSRTLALRDRALSPLRRRYPPPVIADEAPHWAVIPSGTDRLGSEIDSDEPEDQKPARDITLDTFRILDHEVTNAEFRRLFPDHSGADDLPATSVSWYRAYLYAAWLGGRLPTEAEWEYAALGGCDTGLCGAAGDPLPIDEIAWTGSNSTDPATGEPRMQPVHRLAANPFGLHDIHGNAWEWTADWYGPFGREAETNPRGSISGHQRAFRGGGYWMLAANLDPRDRVGLDPAKSYASLGFRVVLPPPENIDSGN